MSYLAGSIPSSMPGFEVPTHSDKSTAKRRCMVGADELAQWLLSQVSSRKLSSDEREWLDRYLIHCRGRLHSGTPRTASFKLWLLTWILAVVGSLAAGVLTWM